MKKPGFLAIWPPTENRPTGAGGRGRGRASGRAGAGALRACGRYRVGAFWPGGRSVRRPGCGVVCGRLRRVAIGGAGRCLPGACRCLRVSVVRAGGCSGFLGAFSGLGKKENPLPVRGAGWDALGGSGRLVEPGRRNLGEAVPGAKVGKSSGDKGGRDCQQYKPSREGVGVGACRECVGRHQCSPGGHGCGGFGSSALPEWAAGVGCGAGGLRGVGCGCHGVGVVSWGG